MEKINLQLLETRIDTLLTAHRQLVEENKMLIVERAQLLAERDSLLEKNALARARLEEMIVRLKAIEMGTTHE